MSSTGTFGAADGRRAGGSLGACVRAAIIGVAWLPALGIVTVFVPKFEDLFTSMRERAELPAVTERLVWFAELNGALCFLPFVLAIAALMLTDLGVAKVMSDSTRKWLYWIWFGGVLVIGVMVAGVVTAVLMLPMLKM